MKIWKIFTEYHKRFGVLVLGYSLLIIL